MEIAILSDLARTLGLDWMSIIAGAIIGLSGGKIGKASILAVFPKSAPFFALFDSGTQQILSVLNRADANLHKNEDLKSCLLYTSPSPRD